MLYIKKRTNVDSLLGQQAGSDSTNSVATKSTNHMLVDQLNSKSALTQYMVIL